MVLRKITIDISVRYIPASEKTKGKEIKPNTIENNSNTGKQNKNNSQNSKKFLLKVSVQGSIYPK